MSKTSTQRKMEARAKRLAVAQAVGDENVDPHSRPVGSMQRLVDRHMARCYADADLAAGSAESMEASFSGDGEDMEMTECTGLGIVDSRPRPSTALDSYQPSTPSVGASCGSVSKPRCRRVNVGIDGETPLQTREVVMTPNEERRQRTWQPRAYEAPLSALHEKSEDDIDSAGRACTDLDTYAEDTGDMLLNIPQPKPTEFCHRDSLMISHNHRTAGSPAQQCNRDATLGQTATCELGNHAPSDRAAPSDSEQNLREEITRLKKIESKLQMQVECERQRRERAEARLSALEVCTNASQLYADSAVR